MTPSADSEEPAWEVGYTDRADADIEAAYNFLALRVGEGKAETWLRGLYFACDALADFPGPFAYPTDDAATAKLGQEVRRLIYRGPKNERPIGAPYRIFFYTVGDEAIFVVRVLHGAAGPWPAPEQ